MNWEAITAIAETAGTSAVVASLVYVGIQVRQNSKLIDQNTLAARSAMVHESAVSYSRFFELIAQDDDLASIYRRGKNGDELNANEITRYIALVEVYVSWLEDVNHQYKSDLYFDEDDDEDIVDFMAPTFRDFLSSPHAREWWESTASDSLTPSMFTKLDRIMARWDAESS